MRVCELSYKRYVVGRSEEHWIGPSLVCACPQEFWEQWIYQYHWYRQDRALALAEVAEDCKQGMGKSEQFASHNELYSTHRCSLKELGPKRCVVWELRSLGKLIIWIASKGHFLTQIPQPMQSSSLRKAILSAGATSIQSFPVHQMVSVVLIQKSGWKEVSFSISDTSLCASVCVNWEGFCLSIHVW